MALNEIILIEVSEEVERFQKRLDSALEKIRNDKFASYGCKETGAVRRAALDLKYELTKITQHYGQ